MVYENVPNNFYIFPLKRRKDITSKEIFFRLNLAAYPAVISLVILSVEV